MSGVTNNILCVSIVASDGALDVYGEEEMPRSICRFSCKSAKSLEENHRWTLSIEVSMIFKWETL